MLVDVNQNAFVAATPPSNKNSQRNFHHFIPENVIQDIVMIMTLII